MWLRVSQVRVWQARLLIVPSKPVSWSNCRRLNWHTHQFLKGGTVDRHSGRIKQNTCVQGHMHCRSCVHLSYGAETPQRQLCWASPTILEIPAPGCICRPIGWALPLVTNTTFRREKSLITSPGGVFIDYLPATTSIPQRTATPAVPAERKTHKVVTGCKPEAIVIKLVPGTPF